MTTPELTIIKNNTDQGAETLRALSRRGDTDLEKVEPKVREIVHDVAKDGDAGVRKYVDRFEKREVKDLLIRDYGGKSKSKKTTKTKKKTSARA